VPAKRSLGRRLSLRLSRNPFDDPEAAAATAAAAVEVVMAAAAVEDASSAAAAAFETFRTTDVLHTDFEAAFDAGFKLGGGPVIFLNPKRERCSLVESRFPPRNGSPLGVQQ
jgi:hypothetical protein